MAAIEGADRLQRVAKEIEPQRLLRARHEEIENAAAHRIFADFAHRRDALEAIAFEPCHEAFHVHDRTGAGQRTPCAAIASADGMRCRTALALGQHQGRGAVAAFSAAIRVIADRRLAATAPPGDTRIIGQAVPGRQFEDRQAGNGRNAQSRPA